MSVSYYSEYSNSPNWATLLFKQAPFDVAKQSVLGHALQSFFLECHKNEQRLLNAFM